MLDNIQTLSKLKCFTLNVVGHNRKDSDVFHEILFTIRRHSRLQNVLRSSTCWVEWDIATYTKRHLNCSSDTTHYDIDFYIVGQKEDAVLARLAL